MSSADPLFDLGPAPVLPPKPAAPPPPPPTLHPRRNMAMPLALAVLAVAIIAGAAFAAINLLSNASTKPLAGWAPSGTAIYLDLRADAPGEQRAALGAILAKFDAYSGLLGNGDLNEVRIDAALDDLFGTMNITTNGGDHITSWTKDFKPWASGEVAVAIEGGALNSAASAGSSGTLPDANGIANQGVVLVAVSDQDAARAWLDANQGAGATTSTYAGGDITVSGDGAFALRERVLIIGREAAVKSALDTGGTGMLAESTTFKSASASAPSDYLGFAYIDTTVINSAMASSLSAGSTLPADCPLASGDTPSADAWAAGSFYADGDSLIFALDMPMGSATFTNTTSASADHLPANTVATIEIRGLGSGLVSFTDALDTEAACFPDYADALAQVTQAINLLGGAQNLVGWMGDASLAVTASDTAQPGGGLVTTVSDDAAAAREVEQLTSFLTLAGLTGSDETVNGSKMVIFDVPSGTIDAVASQIAMATGPGVFVLGTPDFVRDTLNTDATNSLAADEAYARAMNAAGGQGVLDAYLDVAGLRVIAETAMTEEQKAQIDPGLSPIESLSFVTRDADGNMEMRLVVTLVP